MSRFEGKVEEGPEYELEQLKLQYERVNEQRRELEGKYDRLELDNDELKEENRILKETIVRLVVKREA